MNNSRVMIFVDEANVSGAARLFGRRVDWMDLRSYLADEAEGRQLVECVVYLGMPPMDVPSLEAVGQRKRRFLHYLQTQGFLVETVEGVPRGNNPDGTPSYKSNVDVKLGLDALDLAVSTSPDIIVLVTGDGDFAFLANKLRRRGIRVEVAAVDQNLSGKLRAAANSVIQLTERIRTWPTLNGEEAAPIGGADVFD